MEMIMTLIAMCGRGVRGELGAPRRISTREALRVIEENDLTPACGAWHYSWDIQRFYDSMLLQSIDGHLHVFAPKALNEWAPVAHFTSCADAVPLRTAKPEPLPYWFLRLTTFDDFLERRSQASKQPSAHFPSRQTYDGAARRMHCHLERFPLRGHEAQFAKLYDRVKDPRYAHSGEACWMGARAHNPGAPLEWFQVSALIDDETGACRAVQLGIQDHRSCSGINAGAERKSGVGYGIFADVELVRHLSGSGVSSFDCGVSGDYGGYKRKVFLDALPTVVAR